METTRKELFDLVWEYPMTHLAKRIGYSFTLRTSAQQQKIRFNLLYFLCLVLLLL